MGRHPPPQPALPWLPGTASATPSRAPERAARPPLARHGHGRRPVGLGPRGLVALLAVAALAVAAAVSAVVTTAVTARSAAPAVSTPFLSYTAPAGWTSPARGTAAPLDAPALTGTVRGPEYDCGGEPRVRGFATAALLPADASAGSGPPDRAERLARWFATVSYSAPSHTPAGGAAPEVTVAPHRLLRVAGPDGPVDATVVEVTARAATRAGCAPSGGTVLALAAPVSGGAALLLVAGDTDGGPAEPAPPDRAALDAALASVRLGPG